MTPRHRALGVLMALALVLLYVFVLTKGAVLP